MTAIFLDASALVPLQVPRDHWAHAMGRALDAVRAAGQPRFITTNWTLYEALALVSRYGHAHARTLASRGSSHFRVMPVEFDIEAEALRRFLAWTDKTASIVDHANLLMAEKLRCEAIITFDTDFSPLVRAAGIRLIGR